MRLNLSSQGDAVSTVRSLLMAAHYTHIYEELVNDGKHCLITAKSPSGTFENFYVKWENLFFHLAAEKWDELKDRKGKTRGGCTLNVDYIEKAVKNMATILFCSNEDGLVYAISAKEFDEKATQPRKQDYTREEERCMLVEDIKPWNLLPAGMTDEVVIIECDACGYKKVQSRQDIYATELTLCKEGHETTFGHLGHRVTARKTSKFDALALSLRDNLNRWERW